MYQLVMAYGILRDAEGLHQPVTIDNLSLSQIFNQYSNLYAVVTSTTDPTEVAIDVYKLPYQVRFLSLTLQQWFSTIGTATLQTEPVPTGPRQVFVQHWNLHQEDFDIRLANSQLHPDIPLETDQEIDVLLRKPGANYENIVKYGLATINGFLHRLDWNQHGVYAIGAGRSRHQSGKHRVGLLDFQHIGPLSVLGITPNMLYKRRPEQPYTEAVYIELPEPIGQRKVLLSIGGWLHIAEKDFQIVGDTVLRIDFRNYPWFKRFIQTKDWLNLDSLDLAPEDNGSYSIAKLNADATLERWLTLPQSFVVLVDTGELAYGFSELESTQLPGRYYSAVKPQYPVIVGDGRLAEPIVTFERHKWVLAVDNAFRDNVVLDTTAWAVNQTVAYRRESAMPFDYAQAKFLHLSKVLE